VIGAVISAGRATLHECETVYSIGDVYLMMEIVSVDAHNKKLAEEFYRQKSERR